MKDFGTVKRQILDRVDIVQVVQEHVALKRQGRRLVGLCPFHTEKTPSFSVNAEQGFFKCFGCGKGGDAFTFIQLKENVTFGEALRIMADQAGVDLRALGGTRSTGPDRSDLAKVNAWAAEFFRANLLQDSLGHSARAYLQARAIFDSTAERFGLGLAAESRSNLIDAAGKSGFSVEMLLAADLVRRSPDSRLYDTFRNRLMFPIRDAMRRVVGFGGRTLSDDKAKYINTSQNALFDKGSGLYGIDLAREAIVQKSRAVVVEGYMDVLASHQAGFLETVASLGTALTEPQIEVIRRYCSELILLFDSDDAGEAAATRAIRLALPRSITVKLARVPEGKDPCEFLSQAHNCSLSDVLNQAVDALEFAWRQTLLRYGESRSNTGRREAVFEFIGTVVESISTGAMDVIQRGLLANQIASLLQIDVGEVHRLLLQTKAQKSTKTASGVPNVERTTVNSEQAAWATLLEVLVNEPKVIGTLGEPPDPLQIEDPCNRWIAQRIFELIQKLDEFQLSDLLSSCEDSRSAERVLELAERGFQRGNFEATAKLAVSRIRESAGRTALELGKKEWIESVAVATPSSTGERPDMLESVRESFKGHRHFAPRRLIPRAASDVGLESFRKS